MLDLIGSEVRTGKEEAVREFAEKVNDVLSGLDLDVGKAIAQGYWDEIDALLTQEESTDWRSREEKGEL